MPVITLPDGSQRTFSSPVSVYDVAAEIVAGIRVVRVFEKQFAQEAPLEDIDTHGDHRRVGVTRHRFGVDRLLAEFFDPVGFVDRHHTEAGCLV